MFHSIKVVDRGLVVNEAIAIWTLRPSYEKNRGEQNRTGKIEEKDR